MKKIAKIGALFLLLVSTSVLVVGCGGGDAGMGKQEVGSISGLAR